MILQVEGVDKKFGGLLALDHVDLNVEEGEIVGVIGPNGAGKSTLLNVIAGVYRPTVGSVRFRGEKISGLNPERICQLGIARTFQIPRPFSKMTAFENVLVAATFGNLHLKKDPREVTEEMLDFVSFPVSGRDNRLLPEHRPIAPLGSGACLSQPSQAVAVGRICGWTDAERADRPAEADLQNPRPRYNGLDCRASDAPDHAALRPDYGAAIRCQDRRWYARRDRQ